MGTFAQWERLVRGIDQADLFRAVIDDYTAKLAAGYLATSAGPAVHKLAETGQVCEAVPAELRELGESADTQPDTRRICLALADYAAAVGVRDDVTAWPILADRGPTAPPGYMGTYPCATHFLREIGFRVMGLADGSVHIFQEQNAW